MSGLRYAQVSQKEQQFLDVTSLTLEEFGQLVPAFEEAFEQRMKAYLTSDLHAKSSSEFWHFKRYNCLPLGA